ncbi:methyltransferase domain-containing protein [Candidatus Nitrospira neomarina]|uniref:Methyltransferase domain-containing protein n=1 Tax=Candidatus Nitrospira neomarina TaxID=3020899 RepID=A0AA96K502_9BACT|nr:methyltransferase domain-containing protein [Candidatus Nitrospira neomarina]WNM63899.1 methyltransferase domain-containing protein [Candidatus Nitrospira neomarina]
MNQYIFDNKSEEREFQRLQLVEAANDPTTIRLLEETGIQPGWHCLEVGAGAGSILRWMGSQVGPTGLAVGVDKKIAYLHKVDSPPVRIYKGSFLDVPLEQSFDLLHSRYVLIHNQEERAILEKMYSLLKPGGWALFEEPDFTSATLPEPEHKTPQGRVNRAMCQMFINLGLDPAYGLRLPHKLQDAGYHIVRVQSLMHLCPGNSPMAKVMAESAMVLEQEYSKTGLCSPEDIQAYVRLSQDSTHWALYHSTTSVIAQKPII